MEDVEKLLKGTVEELDQLLNAKNVLGDPIERDGATVIPIVSYGFGFGAGGKVDQKSGNSAGTGAGGGISAAGSPGSGGGLSGIRPNETATTPSSVPSSIVVSPMMIAGLVRAGAGGCRPDSCGTRSC